jgi:hypothetical protein
MKSSWRIGLLIGLAALGGRTAAMAQARPGYGSADGRTSATTRAASPSATAMAAARGTADPSFNRVTTTRLAPASGAYRGADRAGTPAGSGAMGQADPFRPYSPRVREAEARAAMSTTRPQQPRVAVQPRVVQSHNYYPGMRISRHPNANAPRCTPGRGAVLAGGVGRGR